VAERTGELAAATERLAQAQKMEAVGRLTSGVAHDFNNLLAVIVGNLDLLGRRLDDEKLSQFVAHARFAADRGAKLTRQLLAFGRRQRMRPQPLELNELIESASALLSSALGPKVAIRARPGPEPVWVTADREQLEMVIMNLALNARDAMPEGGEVTLQTWSATITQPGGGPEAPPPGDYGVLCVCDTGIGMTPEVLAQIWEPFFSTKALGAGSGLGLAQVLGAVQQLGGGVTVQSEPGRGASVQVHLPRAAAPVAAPAPRETAAATPAEAREGVLSGRKIMLVDDDAGVRAVTADLLRDLGCSCEELASGVDALARLDGGARPDALIIDYAMPVMTGAEAARLSGERHPSLPVLLISGYLDAEALEQTWNGPVLAKPFSKAALAARLAQALRRGAGAAADAAKA
jgi:nitrogen-specific signal transduction histidine kinase